MESGNNHRYTPPQVDLTMPRHAPASRAKAPCQTPYQHHIEICAGHGRPPRALRYAAHRAEHEVPSYLPSSLLTAALAVVGFTLGFRSLRRRRNRHLCDLPYRLGQAFIMTSDIKLQTLRKAFHRNTQRVISELRLHPLIYTLTHFLQLSIVKPRDPLQRHCLLQRPHPRRRKASRTRKATQSDTVRPPRTISAARVIRRHRIAVILGPRCGLVRLI